MANFKVNQRVRIVGLVVATPENYEVADLVGREGVITGPETLDWRRAKGLVWKVAVDGVSRTRIFAESELAPLTPPAEDTWAADKVRDVTKPTYIEPETIPARDGVVCW